MKKSIILAILILIFIVPNSLAKLLTISPGAVSFEYTLGDAQHSDTNIVFSNNDNTSFSIALSKNGTGTEFYNISASTLGFNGSVSNTIVVKYGIPSNAEPKLYSSNIVYGSGSEYIPVFITVKTKTTTSTGCKILIPGDFSRSIKKGTPIFTDDFTIQIANSCTNGITITDVRESGQVTVTNQGLQPIKLTGIIPKGKFEKGTTATFKVEFDVSELGLGDYRANILFTATEGDEQLTQKMEFRIFVVGTATAVTNSTFSTLPSCTPQTTDLQIGKSYNLVCNNVVDSNLKLNIDEKSLEFIKGVTFDNPTGQLIWTFTPTKMGNTKLITYFTFNNVPIGERQEFDLRIAQTIFGELGTQLMFDFFPKTLNMDALAGGDTFSVLVKAIKPGDNTSGTIVNDAVLYKDGQKSDTNTFTVNAGGAFTLSASAPGFSSIDKTISVPLSSISLSLPSDIEINSPFTISAYPFDAVLKIDGILINPNNITLIELKLYTLTAEKQGFTSTTLQFQTTPPLQLLNPEKIPKKMKLGEEFNLGYNKPIPWTVLYSEKQNSSAVILATATSSTVAFMPSENGFYRIFVRNEEVANYKVNKFNFSIILWVIAVIVVIYVLVKAFQGRGSSKEESVSKYTFGADESLGGGLE